MRIDSRDLLDSVIVGAVGAGVGAVAAWAISAAVAPAALFCGVSVGVSRLTKPIFNECFGGNDDRSLKAFIGRVLHATLAVAAGAGAVALAAWAFSAMSVSIVALAILSLIVIGFTVALNYLIGTQLPTIIDPNFTPTILKSDFATRPV